ncbi:MULTISPECIES: hypothetical protein [Spirosoma]|uniref:Uncharacterized protein n=1 Tax=Spirosoma sordidisoli TaxID=2502893 RepID=A0A4Q2UT68_9BACT|nr:MULTISPECIES: hypothetical protein [Spirosoma]RYC70995.1 hypothetical protein EQG79_02275 [Spirosoma sordidisoli]
MANTFSIFKEGTSPIKVEGAYRSFDHYKDLVKWTRRRISVLIVVDTSVRIGENDGFGVGRFIKLLRETTVGCTVFKVDIAQRPTVINPADIVFTEVASPGPFEPRYIDFRFDSTSGGNPVLNRYHEVFLFGFAPDNAAGPDTNITSHPWHSTDAELRVLTDWMNQGGGVFATGDHDYLGASMCHRIPRVGSMRKWTNADGVPPINGPSRLDTNRPATPDEDTGVDVIANANESDNLPQTIQWVPQRIIRQGFFRYKYPHRILCHPTHGPINVMPDHPHEGRCEDPATIDYAATVGFGPEKEYPDAGGVQPRPQIIAYGTIEAKLNHQKGPVNAAHFPMISVYDGRSNGSTVGRVVVDSTWHHWFNMNLIGLENAVNKTNWEKISRYFINVALWIAPPNVGRYCYWELLLLHFEYTGLREINRNTPLLEVGIVVRQALWARFGRCWTIDFILSQIPIFRPRLYTYFDKFNPAEKLQSPFDLSDIIQPQFDLIELTLWGHIYRNMEPLADKLRYSLSTTDRNSSLELQAEDIEKATVTGVGTAFEQIDKLMDVDLREITQAFKK